ncbi:hypothetical protein DICPUDRAFT_99676 [Dictyostelium purpureum]|uniref:Uncharacterized protein n=1 Tax=Dictyostelium purpureum TaxID=5786 RepID=F1A1H2_DICPU|nr:uncharacterized protein DICPUDRAFT_99676 [Dictyostelium purpureum]EGC29958.1 hypothetical protein DICPUDRAFT_99676 [Dictyostelium purpureum]|eukprot:XP_003293518.1 hypothetical protein DICPUDRAFT_99676 [Dictyostelium purpureum]
MDQSNKPVFTECLEFKMNQWRPNICCQCFLPKIKHKNIPEIVDSKPLISQSSQTSTITPVSSSTSTKTSTITTHKNANNKTVITYISSTTTTTTTTTATGTTSTNNDNNSLTVKSTASPSPSRTASPNLKSVSPSSYSTVVVPPINKSMSTPGSPILSRSYKSNSGSSNSQIHTTAPKIVPVLKRQFQSFPSIPKISKATLVQNSTDPIILCKYTIESQPPNVSLLKPTLVEFVNQPDSNEPNTKEEHLSPRKDLSIFKTSKVDAITTHKSVSITISTSSSTSPSSTTTTTSTTTSIIAEEPPSPVLSNLSTPTASTIPMSPSLPSIPFHKFETNDDIDSLNIDTNDNSINDDDSFDFETNEDDKELINFNKALGNTTILSGSKSCSSKRNSMNIQPLRIKSFSFSSPIPFVEDDPFEGFEDLVDDDEIIQPEPIKQSQDNNNIENENLKKQENYDDEEDIFKDFEDFEDDSPNTTPNTVSLPNSTITITTTILQSPNIEKTTTTTSTTSSSSSTATSPSTNSRSINVKGSVTNTSSKSLTSLMSSSIPPKPKQLATLTTTNKRRSLKMDQFKENEDEWDQGVDLTSFLKKKPSLQRDFSYYNNKFMEISGVKEEVKKQSIDFGGGLHPNAFEAFKGILEAKQTQIKKAFERNKINEPDCDMLITELNSAQKLLNDLLELNETSPNNDNNQSILNNQSICIKSEI